MSDNQNDPKFQALSEAGIDLNQVPEAQREVLENLSEEEVKTLVSIKKKLDESTEVQGYLASAGKGDTTGYLIY